MSPANHNIMIGYRCSLTAYCRRSHSGKRALRRDNTVKKHLISNLNSEKQYHTSGELGGRGGSENYGYVSPKERQKNPKPQIVVKGSPRIVGAVSREMVNVFVDSTVPKSSYFEEKWRTGLKKIHVGNWVAEQDPNIMVMYLPTKGKRNPKPQVLVKGSPRKVGAVSKEMVNAFVDSIEGKPSHFRQKCSRWEHHEKTFDIQSDSKVHEENRGNEEGILGHKFIKTGFLACGYRLQKEVSHVMLHIKENKGLVDLMNSYNIFD
ncbi:Hypothetical predicted protein [Mytilus galloprovincialis]|uniref:Uncharacterized protein n=1 Tax=Mytilus galloprovincialis TaxID=29158 RepID=A0A8B6FCT2_MYTGA|nr:Hypothetical predicted protein [Mytilus galloprovincialis]